ncbi:MAG: hypothetical protein KKH92_01895 [Firmicutes bacterium]|nr:hypothetical protein [Bacillota bacterium]
MFILAIIGVLVIIYFVFYFVFSIRLERKSFNEISEPIYYAISEDAVFDELTEKQKRVVEHIKQYGTSKEADILLIADVSRSVLKALLLKGVIETTKNNKMDRNKLIFTILNIVILALSMISANYLLLIRTNFRYFGIFFYLFLFGLLVFNIYSKYKKYPIGQKIKVNALTLFGVIGFFLLFVFLGGRPIFYAEEYANLIEVSDANFVSDIQNVDIEKLPLVDKAYGYKLGSLKLGEYPGIGSEFQAGEYSDIIYQGKQYLVAPLEYRGFFKWLNNRDVGTPGYILIDKVTSDTRLINIRETTGEGLKYTPSAFYSQDLFRHAYYNGLSKYRLENQFFEIDEDGNPYYVLQYSLPTIFINGGSKINKIAVVNAITGEVNVYSPGEEPDWVESVYPNSIIFSHLDYWGSLQDGWLNSVFGQRGVLQTSDGTRVIMNDGELYYFTGLTSAGNDESTIGFIYAGMKTNETKLYSFPGATEEAAMNKVLTLIPQNNITTTFPIPINVDGIPSYFILIKGNDGRILRYVYVSVQDLELYSIAENQAGAYTGYLSRLDEEFGQSSAIERSGIISEITSYVSGGNTIYWIQLDNDERFKINVSQFTDAEMAYFISLDIGDTITIQVLNYTVIGIIIE